MESIEQRETTGIETEGGLQFDVAFGFVMQRAPKSFFSFPGPSQNLSNSRSIKSGNPLISNRKAVESDQSNSDSEKGSSSSSSEEEEGANAEKRRSYQKKMRTLDSREKKLTKEEGDKEEEEKGEVEVEASKERIITKEVVKGLHEFFPCLNI